MIAVFVYFAFKLHYVVVTSIYKCILLRAMVILENFVKNPLKVPIEYKYVLFYYINDKQVQFEFHKVKLSI